MIENTKDSCDRVSNGIMQEQDQQQYSHNPGHLKVVNSILDEHQKSIEENVTKTTYTGEDLYNLNADKIPCLIGDIIPKTGIFAVVGASDTGKSILFRQMGISLVEESNFLGWPVNSTHGKVIFVATEDDHIATSYLLRRQSENPEKLKNIRFHFDTENIPDYLHHELGNELVDLVIIDAWSDVFGQNLNDSALIRTTLNLYRSIANTYNCAIGFLHHTGKRTEKLAPSKNNILSGQGFEAKMRLVIELRNDMQDEDFKHLCIVKGNYLGKEFKEKSYKLKLDPETFLFSDTGERVPFDELIAPIEGKEQKQPLTKAPDLDDDTHIKVLNQVFSGMEKPKLSELKTRISSKYEQLLGTTFGAKRTEKYLDYLINDLKLIGKDGKDRSPNAYYYLTTDPLTDPPKKEVSSSKQLTTDPPNIPLGIRG